MSIRFGRKITFTRRGQGENSSTCGHIIMALVFLAFIAICVYFETYRYEKIVAFAEIRPKLIHLENDTLIQSSNRHELNGSLVYLYSKQVKTDPIEDPSFFLVDESSLMLR